MLSCRQKIKIHEHQEMDIRITIIPDRLVGFLPLLKAYLPHPYSQPLPWDLLAMVAATMQAWVLESQPQ